MSWVTKCFKANKTHSTEGDASVMMRDNAVPVLM